MDNRSNLLGCAMQLFTSRGYDGVGVQEIVDAAGITKPTLYHYFGSKLGLLETLLEENFSPLYQAAKKAAEYKHDVTNSLNKIASVYFTFARQNRLFYRLYLSLWFAAPHSDAFRAVTKLTDRQQRLLETLFTQAAEDHGNMRGRHRAYAATFLGMINTYVGLALNDYTELDDQLTNKAVHQFMHGIFS